MSRTPRATASENASQPTSAPERRASYGPTSPVIGERGARTRREIVDVTLDLFAQRGFHATMIDDIAGAAGISRATLYQYFASKEAIFVELVDESGGALLRSVRQMRALGPDADGFAHLQDWLAHWAAAFDHYTVLFVQWANVNSPKAPLRPGLDRFVEAHTRVLGARLADAGPTGCPPDVLAIVLLAVVERFNYMRHVYPSGRTDAELLAQLGVICQRALFPQTPPEVLSVRRPTSGPATAPRAPIVTAASARRVLDHHRDAHCFDELGPQARRTVDLLLAAGATVFAGRGYLASTVDQIVSEAGVARGTLYKYFDDRLHVLVTLSDRAADRLTALVDELATLEPGPDLGRQLRSWLERFRSCHAAHAGVIRAWTEGLPVEPDLAEGGARVMAAATSAFASLLGAVPDAPPTDRRTATRVLLALLERSPEIAAGTRYAPTASDLVEAQALFMERAFLAPTGPARRRPRAPRRPQPVAASDPTRAGAA